MTKNQTGASVANKSQTSLLRPHCFSSFSCSLVDGSRVGSDKTNQNIQVSEEAPRPQQALWNGSLSSVLANRFSLCACAITTPSSFHHRRLARPRPRRVVSFDCCLSCPPFVRIHFAGKAKLPHLSSLICDRHRAVSGEAPLCHP